MARILQTAFLLSLLLGGWPAVAQTAAPPKPLLDANHSVDWWFVFKLNAKTFPSCGGEERSCIFGGKVQDYTFGQQYVFASSDNPVLTKGTGCAGDTPKDPIGATYSEVYEGSYNYVVWNDQFYGDPEIHGCGNACGAPWGHSKGLVAWNDAGEGLAMQVTTPSWPASGSHAHERKSDGNTLGCVTDNDVLVSQHFFSVRLSKQDLENVLDALANASVVTDVSNPQLVHNGGPQEIQSRVKLLGKKITSTTVLKFGLSTGVGLLSKPSKLKVPPWQLVSAQLGGVPLRTATWWANPKINSTTGSTSIACWDPGLGQPGAVQIAITGNWERTEFGLKGGSGPNFNHAKIGVSMADPVEFAIFGDMNQQGTLSADNCGSSQNGRGGLFYIIKDTKLAKSIADLIKGESAPVEGQSK